MRLVLSGSGVVGAVEDRDGAAVFPAETHGESLLGSLVELGWEGVFVRRG